MRRTCFKVLLVATLVFVTFDFARALTWEIKDAGLQDTGNFVIQAGVRVDKLQDVVRTLVRELRKIKDEPIPARELNKAKEYLKGTLTLSLEAHEAKLGWYLEQVAFRKEILEPQVLIKRIDAVTAAGVNKVARDIFQNKKLNLSVIGPKFPEATLRKLLLL